MALENNILVSCLPCTGDEVGTRWILAQASFLSGWPGHRARCPVASTPQSGYLPLPAPAVHTSFCSPLPGCFQKESFLWVYPGNQKTQFLPQGKREALLSPWAQDTIPQLCNPDSPAPQPQTCNTKSMVYSPEPLHPKSLPV